MARVDSEWEKLLKKSQPTVFSDEIMFDILSRLPVKSIIRFKCVCKKWYDLYGDSSFIAAHLERSVEGSNYCNLVGPGYRDVFYLSDENFEELREFPVETEPFFCYKIVASVDGLVCIKKYGPRHFKSSVLLWNPATRESRTLPECAVSIHRNNTAIGFGFDPENKDYKVVLMNYSKESTRVDVYSLRTDKWRSFEVGNFVNFHIPGAHVNGRLHWLGERLLLPDRFIFSFDLTDEKIIEIGVPVNLTIVRPVALKSFGKSLILPLRNNEEEIEIWFVKMYGDLESWSKLYNIPPHPIYGHIWPTRCLFLENGKVIMKCSGNDNMISYDPKNQVYKILHIEGHADIIKYEESLVSVEGDESFSKP